MVNYSRIIGEVMVLLKKPSIFESPSGRAPERAPDGILRRQKLAVAEKYFRWSPDFLWNFWVYIGANPRAKEVQGAHKPVGCGLPLAAGWGLVGPLGLPCLGSQAPWSSSVPKKIFSGIFFRLDSVSKSPLKGVKNMEKTGTGTWHWINKLVPKKI